MEPRAALAALLFDYLLTNINKPLNLPVALASRSRRRFLFVAVRLPDQTVWPRQPVSAIGERQPATAGHSRAAKCEK